MTPILVFDIETVPDAEGIGRVLGFGPELTDASVVEVRHAAAPPGLGDRATISSPRTSSASSRSRARCATTMRCASGRWARPADSEREIVQRFFDGVEKYKPQLVSWNGSTFDLPVLHYRAMIHKIPGCCYWDTGDNDREFKFNNYLSRFHARHTDVMDVLAGYQNRAWAPLDELARLCGFPGKLGMDGSQVAAAFARGEIEAIRNYCETDVANTYLLYQRFQLVRGAIDATEYEREMTVFRAFLEAQPAPHWREFAAAWR
jgi:predicted PolB exonuclease-like 3'-5' exonuclease